ncbi:hypothetical protein OKW26_001398 [Paraburkholderia sp. 32]
MPDFARPSRRANPYPDWLSDVFIMKNHHTFPRRSFLKLTGRAEYNDARLTSFSIFPAAIDAAHPLRFTRVVLQRGQFPYGRIPVAGDTEKIVSSRCVKSGCTGSISSNHPFASDRAGGGQTLPRHAAGRTRRVRRLGGRWLHAARNGLSRRKRFGSISRLGDYFVEAYRQTRTRRTGRAGKGCND